MRSRACSRSGATSSSWASSRSRGSGPTFSTSSSRARPDPRPRSASRSCPVPSRRSRVARRTIRWSTRGSTSRRRWSSGGGASRALSARSWTGPSRTRARASRRPRSEARPRSASRSSFGECGDPGEARRRLRALGGPLARPGCWPRSRRRRTAGGPFGAPSASRATGGTSRLGVGSPSRTRRPDTPWRPSASRPSACRSRPRIRWRLATLAEVLHGNGRYRDAIEPARAALVRGHDEVAGRVLLARSLSRIGPEGREEATALALAVIEAHPGEESPAGAELADMARIAHDGGAPIERCRLADDRVLALRQTADRPEEWLGAAVARRCHGLFAKDAPTSLARLAAVAVAEPVELARWLVERVEALPALSPRRWPCARRAGSRTSRRSGGS